MAAGIRWLCLVSGIAGLCLLVNVVMLADRNQNSDRSSESEYRSRQMRDTSRTDTPDKPMCLNYVIGSDRSYVIDGLSSRREKVITYEKCEHVLTKALKVNRNLSLEVGVARDMLTLLSEPAVHEHSFRYLYKPTCGNSTVDLLLAVTSDIDNFSRRQNARQIITGDLQKKTGIRCKMIFFIGKMSQNLSDSHVVNQIENEAKQHGDIVQESYEDVFKNIRVKVTSMLKWTSTYCGKAKYVIKMNDDVDLDVPALYAALKNARRNSEHFILGHIRLNMKPIRDVKHMWYISKQEYPDSTFPAFLNRKLFGLPVPTAKLLYQVVLRTKPIWLDDVYVTGLCPARANITLLDSAEFRTQMYRNSTSLRSKFSLSSRTNKNPN
ncbi:beta-1,3-galactosyltransferase 1-like [Physella acuta]|uniref:beta-1,3-galactosyltransferase 1-like n=1 Tax=Physella acuta TaxID=109671 RepID=UPI0027DE049B|nr:beta-1,3-galactosyltransferase 1-like [Physella acuta]